MPAIPHHLNQRTIQYDQLNPGDVILCVLSGREAAIVAKKTGSRYTHAGICYSSTEVVEVMEGGIRKTSIQQFVSECVHAAVLRNPYVWTQSRVKKLQDFLDDRIKEHTGYDEEGKKTFRTRQHDHKLTLLAKVNAYFTEGLKPEPHKKRQYICSELVVACFNEVGIIPSDNAAAIAFQSNTYSAGDLGKDTNFGFFVGYLKPESTVIIPDSDEFATAQTLSEIEQNEKRI